jgi:3-hydroxybutyryl-CoA dehydrogenase
MSEQRVIERVVVVYSCAFGADLAQAVTAALPSAKTFDLTTSRELSEELRAALASATLLLDTTTSMGDEKRALLRAIDQLSSADVPIISCSLTRNTTELATACTQPARLCGFGYIPPLAEVAIVEVAPGLLTSDATRAACLSLFESLGKETALVADGAGLVSARIVSLIINEAAYALSEGVASASDIDAAVKLGANYPYGPLEWADRLGIDFVYKIITAMYQELGEDRYRGAPLLRKMVLAGQTGRAAGRGFYEYPAGAQ